MHTVFGKILKYTLWFLFAVVLGSFLIGFAKFGFQPTLYIEYLNSISLSQLFAGSASTEEQLNLSWTLASSWVVVESGMMTTTGTQSSWSLSADTSSNESYGFVKNLDTWYQHQSDDVQSSPSEVTPSSSRSATGTTSPAVSSSDSRKELLNLIKSKEQ